MEELFTSIIPIIAVIALVISKVVKAAGSQSQRSSQSAVRSAMMRHIPPPYAQQDDDDEEDMEYAAKAKTAAPSPAPPAPDIVTVTHYDYHAQPQTYEEQPAFGETSMGEGYSGEYCQTHYDKRPVSVISDQEPVQAAPHPALSRLTREGFKEAFVLTQVLGRPGGRRNSL